MDTIEHNLLTYHGGVVLLAPDDIEWPTNYVWDFDSCCGPGEIGNYVIADTLFGLRISAACFAHDYMWKKAGPTWVDFHHANSTFMHNMIAIILERGGFLKYFRILQAAFYYMAVDIGAKAKLFWTMK